MGVDLTLESLTEPDEDGAAASARRRRWRRTPPAPGTTAPPPSKARTARARSSALDTVVGDVLPFDRHACGDHRQRPATRRRQRWSGTPR